jgi:methyl-accepting chemotaxis protein
MFQYRSSAFGSSVAAIQKHLGAVEKELEKIGRIAGDRTSAAAATASDQLGDAISTILNEMVERFRQGRQAAGDQAGRLSDQALNLGAKYGSDALQRAASEERPLVTVAIALGIGILIGAAVLTGTGSSRRRR